MYRKIMVPLDGSELAECVMPHVEAITTGCKITRVVFLRVVNPVQVVAREYPLLPRYPGRHHLERPS